MGPRMREMHSVSKSQYTGYESADCACAIRMMEHSPQQTIRMLLCTAVRRGLSHEQLTAEPCAAPTDYFTSLGSKPAGPCGTTVRMSCMYLVLPTKRCLSLARSDSVMKRRLTKSAPRLACCDHPRSQRPLQG